jgi:SAM-dependent methyltransferase
MAHFAQLDEGHLVTRVITVANAAINDLPFPESEPVGVTFCQLLYGSTTVWKQTSYNANFRKNYAGIRFTYDPVLDAFILPQPYPSWLLNTSTCQWEAPVPYPTDGLVYEWDEVTLSWVRVYTSFIPSPSNVISAVMAHVSPTDIFYDLGSGDGRVLLAAKNAGAQVNGVEIDPSMINDCDASVKGACFLGDVAFFDFSNATAIYMFLDAPTCNFIADRLKALNPGTKVFSYAFNILSLPNPTTEIFDGVPLYSWVLAEQP